MVLDRELEVCREKIMVVLADEDRLESHAQRQQMLEAIQLGG